jgi:hypothetical protein
MADVEFTIGAIDKASSAISGIRGAILSMNQAVQLAGQVYQAVNKIISATIGEYVKYADQVRRLSQLNGTTAQETSRLIQVTDDYKISVDALTMATRTLSKDGQSLTVDTLSKMSDEYNKLGTSAQKTAFLIEKFGRSGLQFAEMMQSGSAAIKSSGSLAGLILNERDLKMARDYEKAMDELGDTVQSFKVTAGKDFIPWWTSVIMKITEATQAQMQYTEAVHQAQLAETRGPGGRAGEGTRATIQAYEDYQVAIQRTRGEMERMIDTTGQLTDYSEELAKVISDQTSWQLMYTNAKNATEQSSVSLDWLGEQLQGLSAAGADVWQGYLIATTKISPAAVKEFINIQYIWGETKRMVEAGIKSSVIIQWIMSTTGDYAGADPAFSRWQGNQPSSSTVVNSGNPYWIPDPSNPGHYMVNPAKKAAGGYVSGRYAITGDSLSGRRTGFEELVDFQTKRVYSAPQTQAMGAVPGYAAGSGEITLSRESINALKDAIMYGVAGLQ